MQFIEGGRGLRRVFPASCASTAVSVGERFRRGASPAQGQAEFEGRRRLGGFWVECWTLVKGYRRFGRASRGATRGGWVGSPRCWSLRVTEAVSVRKAMIRIGAPQCGQSSGGQLVEYRQQHRPQGSSMRSVQRFCGSVHRRRRRAACRQARGHLRGHSCQSASRHRRHWSSARTNRSRAKTRRPRGRPRDSTPAGPPPPSAGRDNVPS